MVMGKKISISMPCLPPGFSSRQHPSAPAVSAPNSSSLPAPEGGLTSDVATATSTQPTGEMAYGLNSRHLNADNTHYVVPLRTQKVPRTIVLSDTIEAIYDITDARLEGHITARVVSTRKAVGRRLLRAIEYGWMSGTAKYSTPDEDLLLILIGLSQAELIRDDVMEEIEAAMDAIEKDMEPDYWWRNL